jgi:hypothetical protein
MLVSDFCILSTILLVAEEAKSAAMVELAFVVNYDVKYRMGAPAGEEGDDE